MAKSLLRLAFLFVPLTLGARTVTLHVYPPEIRVHANGSGQTILLIATDEEGVSADVTSGAVWQVSDPAIGSVESRTVKGNRPGSMSLKASFDGISVTAPVEV